MGDRDRNLSVIQSLPVWLPRTSPWLFNQVRCLPNDIVSHIVCDRTDNLDQFNHPRISNLQSQPRVRRWWNNGLRRAHLRTYSGLLVSAVRTTRAPLVHSHWGDSAWRDRGAVRRTGARHVVTFYGKEVNFLPRQDRRWLDRYAELFDSADLFLCEGPHMGRCLVAIGCAEPKIAIHHLGVDIDQIEFRPRQWTPGTTFRVLIAASFREKKGIPHALEALASLVDRGVDLQITLIGDASEDQRSQVEKRRIERTLDDTGLRPRTRLLGYQSYARFFEETYEHHVFVSPSITASDGDTEGGAPVSLIDVAATGMPIVSTTHCDIPEVVRNGETGLLAPEGDVAGLAVHLAWLVDNPARWDALVTAGRRHVEAEFDVHAQSLRLASRYRGLV